MRFHMINLLFCGSALVWSSAAIGQTAYLEGHIFNREAAVPIKGAAFVVYENVTLGPIPFLLAEGVTDANGFFQANITSAFPFGIIEVFCRTPDGDVVRGKSHAPLQAGIIRRRDIYLKTKRSLRECLELEPGDLPLFRRPGS